MKKRIFSLLLCAALCVGLLPTMALAAGMCTCDTRCEPGAVNGGCELCKDAGSTLNQVCTGKKQDMAIMLGTSGLDKPEEASSNPSHSSGAVSTGPLANYTGRAYGIIRDYSYALNEDGKMVQILDFLYGGGVCSLVTDGKVVTFFRFYPRGFLSILELNNGVVTKVDIGNGDRDSIIPGSKLKTLTNNGCRVNAVEEKDGVVIVKTISQNDRVPEDWKISDDAVIYVSQAETYGEHPVEYELGTIQSIEKGMNIYLYAISDVDAGTLQTNCGPADIVIVNKAKGDQDPTAP